MSEFKWEHLQQVLGKERFTLAEAIPALIDNQEQLRILDDDLAHIIAILFKFEVAPDNCLIFTTFNGLLRPKDLAETRQIIKDHKNPISIDSKEYHFFDGLSDLITGGKNLNEVFEVGIDVAKEGGDSTSIVIHTDLTPIMKELAEERRKNKLSKENKLPLFLRNK